MELNLTRPIAFFDLETTGIKISVDRIIEISIVKALPDGTSKIMTRRINPEMPIPRESTAIHGIRDEDVANEPTFREIAHEIKEFFDLADLAGFNSNHFDIPMLVEEFLRADIEFDLKGRRFVDVQNIFHKMEPRNLKAAYKFYCDRELVNAHSAEADATATYEILKAQVERYQNVVIKDRYGRESKPFTNDIKYLSDFSHTTKSADLVGHIIFNEKNVEVFNFGKYKGKVVEEIFNIEPSYYDWMMKGDFPLSTKKVITSIKLRGFNRNSVKLELF